MKVSATLKGSPDNLGRRKVYIRINDGFKRKFIPTKIRVSKSDWDGKVKASHPSYILFNTAIKKLILETEANLYNKQEKYPDANFKSYVTGCLNEWDKTKAWGTIKQLAGERGKVDSFAPNLKLSQITPDFLTGYQKYCYSLGNSSNTVWKCFKFLRLIVRKAVKEKVIRDNPFDIFPMPKYKDPKKIYLTKKQVDQIDKSCLDKKCPPELSIAGTWFVIACYTGLRYSDLASFSTDHIKNDRLNIYTRKTGDLVSMPVKGKLKELLERVGYKALPYSNTHYNRLLKGIGSKAKIKEELTSHLARHTFATLCAAAGISPEVTAKFMGIVNLKTIAVYYKLASERMDSELEKLF